MSLYYRNDLSLSEIAEECDVSRQAVYDTIRRTEQIVEDYEQKLELYAKFKHRQQLLKQLSEAVELEKNTKNVQKVIKKLEKLD